MSDELRAAAERLRNSSGCSHWEGADMLTVCNAYLAEHSVDDVGLITFDDADEAIGHHFDLVSNDDGSIYVGLCISTKRELRLLKQIHDENQSSQ